MTSRSGCNDIEERLRQIPGVTDVALSDSMPPSGGMHGRPLANLMFEDHRTLNKSGMVAFRYVTPSYFRTLRIPLLFGRVFTESERQRPLATLVISEGLARQLFGARVNPLGKWISLDGGTHWVSIIGVVRDVKNDGLAVAPWPEYFVLRTTDNVQLRSHVVAFLRSELDVPTLSTFVQRQVQGADPSVAFSIDSMQEQIRRLSDSSRFLLAVMGVFAFTSLFLAGSGLYGIVSFLVQGQRSELGIRAALGASRCDVLMLVQRQTLPWTCSAVLVGLALSVVFARLVRGLLYQVAPADPLLLGISALFLILVTIVAVWQPTLRAMRIDPVDCLRAE